MSSVLQPFDHEVLEKLNAGCDEDSNYESRRSLWSFIQSEWLCQSSWQAIFQDTVNEHCYAISIGAKIAAQDFPRFQWVNTQTFVSRCNRPERVASVSGQRWCACVAASLSAIQLKSTSTTLYIIHLCIQRRRRLIVKLLFHHTWKKHQLSLKKFTEILLYSKCSSRSAK